jgi:hypothetical protein
LSLVWTSCRNLQLRLWPELDAVPPDFVLYGGTGLALQLGHRASEDFDFFSSSGFEPDRLRSRLPFFRDLDPADPDTWLHHKRDNLQRVQDPRQAAGSRVHVASLLDLAGMKMRVIQVRGHWKDYMDIHALTSHGIDLPTALAAAKGIDKNFDPATSIRALQFYGDGTLDRSR